MRRSGSPPALAGFNPLHCGAVVASSCLGQGTGFIRPVSIPFIAGQWSLPANGFGVGVSVNFVVSIPFIAGQWSLPLNWFLETDVIFLFQSPSLRGSGRFFGMRRRSWRASSSFNPLHCGAVVASCGSPTPHARSSSSFNPLHCGAVVASRKRASTSCSASLVSIPFIAGQWSLPGVDARHGAALPRCFNPLHCGAVVASVRREWDRLPFPKRFNPLHCGAVVASKCNKP